MELFDYNVDIILDDKKITPRQNITGKVVINVHTALFLRQAFIEVVGKASCAWTKKGRFGKLFDKHFRGEQQFFYCKHTLAGDDGAEVILERNSYSFLFKCKLPGHLPASWTGEFGSIKYIASVGIQFDDDCLAKHPKEIKIYPFRNLKFEPYLAIESKRSIKRTYRFGFLKLGDVTLTVWLPLTGIAAGQELPLICTIENKSSVLFGGIVFFLTAIEVYRSNNPYYSIKTNRRDICRVAKMSDVIKGTQEFYCVLKTDSSIFPTTQYWRCGTCQLIYEVWVQLQGSLPSNSAYGYPNSDLPGIPLILGTEPLQEWNINYVNKQVYSTLTTDREAFEVDDPPPEDVVEEILNTVEEDFDQEMRSNLMKQIEINETAMNDSKTEKYNNLLNVTTLL